MGAADIWRFGQAIGPLMGVSLTITICAHGHVLCLSTGGARLSGNMGSHKRAAADDGLDAFLGLKPSGGSGGGGGGQRSGGRGAAAAGQSLDSIEQMLLQAAPQDLSEAVKHKSKKHKKKRDSSSGK